MKAAPVIGVIVALSGLGCSGLLDVENPNSVTDDDLRNDRNASVWANGALYTVQQGWDAMLQKASFVSDELTFDGPRSAWDELDRGNLLNLSNEATEQGYQLLARARWMADESIFVLDSLDESGALTDRSQLARSYLYGAIAYWAIASWFDDFAPSDRTEPGPALGPANMGTLLDRAVEYLTAALQIDADDELNRNAFAMRARVHHARSVWAEIGQVPITLANGGLVSNDDAVQDARNALQDPSDWSFTFAFQSSGQLPSSTACEANGCFHGRLGDVYAVLGSDGRTAQSIALLDPIDGIPDPRLEQFVLDDLANAGDQVYVDLPVITARELHLIIAEDALAQGDTTGFADEINGVRTQGGLSVWTPASSATATQMLVYERQVNLFLQGHRLADMYRFGITSDEWDLTAVTRTAPGTLFPIPQSEIDANCHLNPGVACN